MSFHIDLNDIQHTYVDDIASLSPRSHQSDGSYYPLEDQRRNRLCVEILDLISNSVMTFRPSQSLASLDCLEPTSAPAIEIDIVISGGGLKGYFMTGCSHILKRELQKQNVKIARIAGASAGAWCALFMLTNLDTENWIETYYLCKERPDMTMHEAYDDIWPWLNSHLPENAWQLCSGRLFISVTEVTLFGLRNHMISEYTSNRDIFEACLASSTVPYLSLPQCFRLYRGMYVLDGGVTNNTPIFPDNARRQLIFRLSDVFYPVRFLINPHDFCIESLVVRGAILMSRFLQGSPSDSFSWLNPSGSIKNDSEKRIKMLQNDNKLAGSTQSVSSWRSMIVVSGTALVIVGAGLYLIRSDYSNYLRKFAKLLKV